MGRISHPHAVASRGFRSVAVRIDGEQGRSATSRNGAIVGPHARDGGRRSVTSRGWPAGGTGDVLGPAPQYPVLDHPPGVINHSTLESVEWWYDLHGTSRRIDDMSSGLLAACIGMLEPRARRLSGPDASSVGYWTPAPAPIMSGRALGLGDRWLGGMPSQRVDHLRRISSWMIDRAMMRAIATNEASFTFIYLTSDLRPH